MALGTLFVGRVSANIRHFIYNIYLFSVNGSNFQGHNLCAVWQLLHQMLI